jgi:NAD(P)-dependent dehydrogenase (short-subunit alcohol dehydrogenase family)
MALYRANAKDGVAWVTGASSGIGRQLSLDLAGLGYTVAATARSEDKLARLAAESAGSPGRIIPFTGDVTDQAAMERVVRAIELEAGPIALAILNAGAYFAARGDQLDPGSFVKTYAVNVLGVVNGLAPVIGRMKLRGRGHVAIIGSISGYGGLPMAAAYGASKAALTHMAASLKFDLDPLNIRIQIINPGFVETPLTEKNKYPMPKIMQTDRAAHRIMTGLESGGFEVNFPRSVSRVFKLLNLLPYSLYFPLMTRITGWNRRPARPSAVEERGL